MERTLLFRDMRDLLAGLFPGEQNALTVVRDAELDVRLIAFSRRPIDNWRAILEQAAEQDQVLAVLDAASAQHPNNRTIQDYCAKYQYWEDRGSPMTEREQRLEVLSTHYSLLPPWNGASGVPARLLRRHSRLLDDYRSFGGRDSELARLGDFVATEPSGYLLVTGGLGLGKSALLANWIRSRQEQDEPVCYTFINRAHNVAGERFALQNLCEQLAHYHGLRGKLPVDEIDLRALYADLLELPVPPEAGQKLAVVLDGLDEAVDWSPGAELFPPNLPPGTHVIFSAQEMPNVDWLARLELLEVAQPPFHLKAMDTEALESLLKGAGGRAAGLAAEPGFAQAVYDVSQGDPYYLGCLVQDIQRGDVTAENISEQRPNLDKYWAKWWEELAQDVNFEEKELYDLLGILSVAKGHLLPRDFAGISPNLRRGALIRTQLSGSLRRYLTGDRETGYAIGHPRFREYLSRSRFEPYEVKEYLDQVLIFCENWQSHNPPSTYALAHSAAHLEDVVDQSSPSARGAPIEALVKLTTARAFQDSHLEVVADLPALQTDLGRGLKAAASGPGPGMLPLVTESALSLVELRDRELRPDAVFALARQGDLQAARRRLELFDIETEWRRAIVLLLAWVASKEHKKVARDERDDQEPNRPPAEPLGSLWDWLSVALDDAQPPEPNMERPLSREALRAILDHMAGSGDLELLARQQEMLADVALGTSGELQGQLGYLSAQDGPHLVAYAREYEKEGDAFLEQYLQIHAGFTYPQYRNRSLWLLLDAVLHHPDAGWVRRTVEQLAFIVLGSGRWDFREALPIALRAIRARESGDGGAWSMALQKAYDEAAPLEMDGGPGPSDVVGEHKRRLSAYAEASWQVPELADSHLTIKEMCRLARHLRYGYAGYGMPAYLNLAEAMRICLPDPGDPVAFALERARSSAHNINDDTYCLRSTARFNAMHEIWWQPGGIPNLAGVVERLVEDPSSEEFATLHLAGEPYSERLPNFRLPLPSRVREASTLLALAAAYKRPLAEIRRLNRAHEWPIDMPLAPGTQVRIPDPGFAPLLAARFAAEALVKPALSPLERRELIQSLVPLAAADPTTLDTVLARLVLADPQAASGCLDELERVCQYPLNPVEPPDGRVGIPT